MQRAILLHATLAPGVAAPWTDELLHALPYARRLQLERADAAARTATLGGLALALAGAARVSGTWFRIGEFRFATGAKPRLEHGPYFSVSHTSNRVACVACAALDLGLDIESVPLEATAEARRALARWTATEATLKAAGLGLRHVRDVALEEPVCAAVLHHRRYSLRELQFDAYTRGHVASPQPVQLLVDRVALDDAEVSTALQRALGLPTQV